MFYAMPHAVSVRRQAAYCCQHGARSFVRVRLSEMSASQQACVVRRAFVHSARCYVMRRQRVRVAFCVRLRAAPPARVATAPWRRPVKNEVVEVQIA